MLNTGIDAIQLNTDFAQKRDPPIFAKKDQDAQGEIGEPDHIHILTTDKLAGDPGLNRIKRLCLLALFGHEKQLRNVPGTGCIQLRIQLHQRQLTILDLDQQHDLATKPALDIG